MENKEKLTSMFRTMVRIRKFEEKAMEMHKEGMVPGLLHISIGQEACAAGVCLALRRSDFIVSTHRGHGHSIAKGLPPNEVMSELFGKETGCCKGLGGSMHATDPEHGILFSTAIVGGGIPIAVGAGLSIKTRKTDQVVVCFFGDGANNIGSFHEALNLASLWKLPVIFICENNMYGISASVTRSTATKDISKRANSYDMPGIAVDGNDCEAVFDAASKAVENAREGNGPTLIECRTYRWMGHHMLDPGTAYRSEEEISEWKRKCPVQRMKKKVLENNILTEDQVLEIEEEAAKEMDEAAKFASEASYPSVEYLTENVFPTAEENVVYQDTRIATDREITFAEAIREALTEEMERDEKVILFGEDVGVFGGVFKVTKGLIDRFGPERIRDTPISETAIIGAAIGSAITGLRPVAEIMYMDFLNVCMDQLVNHGAKMYFMTGGQLKVPTVIRVQSSLGRYTGGQHSQFFPSVFYQFPGLKVVAPSTPYDAKGLLKSAIRDDGPILFIETGVLYFSKGLVPEREYLIPIGKADIKKEGKDATIITFSQMTQKALSAAEKLKSGGIDVEVIDLRTISPIDKKTIIESLKKTGRVIIAEASNKSGGVGAELSAMLTEEAFDYFDSPVVRVAAPDTPIPFSPKLQDHYYIPTEERIAEVVKKVVLG